MAKALALPLVHAAARLHALDVLRAALVLGCAAALALAGQAFPTLP